MGKDQLWTKEEENLLIANHEKPIDELKVLFPDRTKQSVQCKKQKLGFAKHPWTESEKEILLSNAEKSIEELIFLLPGKPMNEIKRKSKTKLKKLIGIYRIDCLATGKFYIGSSENISKRWSAHVNALRRGDHNNPYLQKSWNKYGVDNFEFSIVEEVEIKFLLIREQHWLDETKCYEPDIGFNLLDKAVEPYSAEEMKIIKDSHDKSLSEVLELLPGRDFRQVSKKRVKFGIKKATIRWTQEEIEILLQNKDKTLQELAELLPNRRRNSVISRKRMELGLSKPHPPNVYWTAAEEEILRSNKSIDELMEIFPKRKLNQIRSKLQHMGLTNKAPERWSLTEIDILKQNVDKLAIEMQAMLPERSLYSIQLKRSRMKIKWRSNREDCSAII